MSHSTNISCILFVKHKPLALSLIVFLSDQNGHSTTTSVSSRFLNSNLPSLYILLNLAKCKSITIRFSKQILYMRSQFVSLANVYLIRFHWKPKISYCKASFSKPGWSYRQSRSKHTERRYWSVIWSNKPACIEWRVPRWQYIQTPFEEFDVFLSRKIFPCLWWFFLTNRLQTSLHQPPRHSRLELFKISSQLISSFSRLSLLRAIKNPEYSQLSPQSKTSSGKGPR